MSQKWAWLIRDAVGDHVRLNFYADNVRFESMHHRRNTNPARKAVTDLADDFEKAPNDIRAAILLHYTYWPKMLAQITEELHDRRHKRKREEADAMRKVRRKWQIRDPAPHSQWTPAIIALPDRGVYMPLAPQPPPPVALPPVAPPPPVAPSPQVAPQPPPPLAPAPHMAGWSEEEVADYNRLNALMYSSSDSDSDDVQG